MRTISDTPGPQSAKRVIDQVERRCRRDHHAPRCTGCRRDVLLETFNSWQETVHLLQTPANAAHLAESIGQLRAGKLEPHPLTDG